MNPHEWKDVIQRLKRHLEPNDQSAVNSSVGNASTSSNNWNTYDEYTTRHTVVKPHGSNVGWTEPSCPSHNVYRVDSKLEETDGEVLEMSEEDEELARKKLQLREIEERIIHKKASIALKTVGQFVTKTAGDVSCEGETLRDRVNVILQQRCPLGFLSKVRSRKDRTNSSSLSKEGLLQEQHPLKLRVKALMKQRRSDAFIHLSNRKEAPEIPLPPPSHSLTSPAKEENSVNKGFERFLSILNKGVDIDILSRIVNDDRVNLPLGEELPNIQTSDIEKKSDPVFRSESQLSNSQTNSSETKTNSLTERLSLPDAEEKKNDGGHHSLGSSSRSKSPPAAKKRKKKKEEEEKPKVDEKQEQLQNILKTLGLSLEVEEMCRLADRTQERLYGKKTEGRQRTDSRGEQESRQRGSNRDSSSSSYSSSSSSSSSSPSSSSSSSCSSSRSSSRSLSRSPSRHQREDSGHSIEEAQKDSEKDGMNSQQLSTYQHPYTQYQTFPPPHPAAFPDYSLLQYSHYTNNHSDTYSAATHSPWSQTAIPYPNVSVPIVPVLKNSFHRNHCLENIVSFDNPDLAKSEGQGVAASRPRCLTAVTTLQPKKEPCLKYLAGGQRRRGKQTIQQVKNRNKRRKLKRKEKARLKSAKKAEASQGSQDDSKTKQLDEEKAEPTEEEIKANLRKKLEAFNQKAKHTSQLPQSTVMQPANSSENG